MENINVKAVVSLLGLNEHTLRAWERRHHAISPERASNGRRAYSRQDVDRLRLLQALVGKGHSIGTIAPLSDAKLKNLLGAPEPKPASAPGASLAHLSQIVAPLEKFDLEKLNQALVTARFELSQKDLVMNLILPLMAEVGKMVAQDKLSIAQEHVLSSLLRDHIGQIYHSLSPYEFSSRLGAETFALTTREGDIHEFGILISAILCALHRKKTHYLGPNMPATELIYACKQFAIQNLVLGISAIPAEKEVISAQKFVAQLDRSLPPSISFWLGGSAPVDVAALRSKRKIQFISRIEDFDLQLAGKL